MRVSQLSLTMIHPKNIRQLISSDATIFAKSEDCPYLVFRSPENSPFFFGTDIAAGRASCTQSYIEDTMKIYNKLWRNAVVPVTAGLMLLESTSAYAARCEYVIQSEWNSGFVAAVRITNDTSTVINGWSVNWSYTDGSQRTGGWNANFSGSNPYAASNVGWNGKINPGQTAQFGIQGNKGVHNSPAAKPTITGAVCVGQASSVSSARSSPSFSSSSSFSIPGSSSSRISSTPSSASRSSSSFGVSSTSASTSSSYSAGPNLPEVDLQVSVHGMTVHVDTRGSTDIDGDPLYHSVSFGDGAKLAYPDVWHTYQEPGTYIIEANVSDTAVGGRGNTKTYAVTVEAVTGNQAPIARMAGRRYLQSIDAYGKSSFDWEGTPLTYEWDFGDGPFLGNASASVYDCGSSSSFSSSASSRSNSSASGDRTRLVTLTVSDGELKDTVQQVLGGSCGLIQDKIATAAFSYVVEGNKVSVDASASRDETAFSWNFGDGTTGSGLFASHTYASLGTYQIRLSLSNMGSYGGVFDNITKSIVIESGSSISSVTSSSVSSSSSFDPSSSVNSSSISSSEISSSTSSVRSSSSQASSDRNRYNAPRATTAPVVDGVVDSVWERASWTPINVFWLGTQSNPSEQDYSGRYKALWDENYLYVLYDITDDRIYDGVRNALDRYWEDDTVELFIDENKNGGQHGYNTSAWAYHISTYGDVVDSTTGGATLLNDHIDNRQVSNGNQHYWEMRIRIFGEDYADWKSNTPLQLYAGKLMGFSACYIDNDGSSQRESMMGSVDTQGHRNNQGYLDAGSFGSLLLVE